MSIDPELNRTVCIIINLINFPDAVAVMNFQAPQDRALIHIVAVALADVTRRSGQRLVCRPGCSQCCIGAFAINQLDAWRLRTGMADLEAGDPERAEQVRLRARDAVKRLAEDFPGDQRTGLLGESEEAAQRFSEFANQEPCPVLDPKTGTCDLYASRPMTCRVFGPPVRQEGGLATCELCFQGATGAEIAACELNADPDDMESALLKRLEKDSGVHGETTVAFCLGL